MLLHSVLSTVSTALGYFRNENREESFFGEGSSFKTYLHDVSSKSRPGVDDLRTDGWGSSDWDSYWMTERLPEQLVEAQHRWTGRIVRFGAIKNLDLDSVADVGCGPALALFELAAKLPRTEFYGYDLSAAVVERNSERARRLGLRNLSFGTIRLPNAPEGHGFDLVLCIATLHYVQRNVESIRNLYGILGSRGFLIFNYPNRYTMFWYRRNPDEAMKRRFALLIAGKNVLTQKRIENALGVSCYNFWREMRERVQRANPCLYARHRAVAIDD